MRELEEEKMEEEGRGDTACHVGELRLDDKLKKTHCTKKKKKWRKFKKNEKSIVQFEEQQMIDERAVTMERRCDKKKHDVV